NKVEKSNLLLVGDGPERFLMEEMCRELDLCDRVKFLGKIQDTRHVLQISDLFLLPSETESFGLAALEAMAVGVPVISSNTGGIPEVNIHGVSGLLSNVGDIDDMAKNALEILSSKESLEKYSQNAIQRAREFDIHKIVSQYELLYMKILKSA
ncbi:MAG TPA: glycosyltransferase, partial [Crocinitomicaceae bacterium]|nr:glycosyltransferase [Crocinitomicaceae bacterium]